MKKLELVLGEARSNGAESADSDEFSRWNVHAIGYAGRLVTGGDFSGQAFSDSYKWMELTDWPEEQSERLVAFYRRFLQRKNTASGRLWNGHGLVAATLGYCVEWSSEHIPIGLKSGGACDPHSLMGSRPYVVTQSQAVQQSFISLIGNDTLSVPGRGRSLQVMTVDAVLAIYGNAVHEVAGLANHPDALGELTKEGAGMYDLPNPTLN